MKRLALTLTLLLGCSPGTTSGPGPDGSPDSSHNDSGHDTGPLCSRTDNYCAYDGRQTLRCDPNTGEEQVVEECGDGRACIASACQDVVCSPRMSQCIDGDNTSHNICREDGSGWDTVPCPEGQRCSQEIQACEPPCALRVFILLDQSGSMGGDVQPTKWAQAREALAILMSSPAAASVEFGFGTFPARGDDCEVDSLIVHPLPTATAAMVDEFFATHNPGGNTPLLAGYGEIYYHPADFGLGDPNYHDFILVVSDGGDTCHENACERECGLFNIGCLMGCQDRAEQQVIEYLAYGSGVLRDEHQIRSFAIGFGEGVSPEELTAIAANGGTAIGDWLVASDVEQLTEAFDNILDEMLECNPIY